ncbi:hypothetical protein [Chryseobacterium koreense]|uniref:Beta-carotene 15,15'-monooxygenase n=1 Tax=Chryseobacterium koreense CCUG 49689 TaxID=1304281 RepID=A0A0J7J014_9FLAO|nr:hypothetical protein [Chryseobacterium koreense]KMQ71416.1 hypothetical protein ACM44_07290 [Chryseobacterium koreense CCUG 49689]MBB5332256.1 hypothetical protein [Chryseobacterium koreense]
MRFLENSLFIFAILIFVAFGYFTFFNVYQTDDYIFSFFTRKFGFFGAACDLYLHWGGRYFGYSLNLLNPVALDSENLLPKIYPMLLMVLFITVVAVNFREFFGYSLADSFKKSFLFFFFYTVLLLSLPEHFFWITGSNIYFLPVIFSGILLFCLKKFHSGKEKGWLYISMILIVLTIGNNEIIALILEGSLLVNYFYRRNKAHLLLAIVSTVCLFASFLAPGNFGRMAENNDEFIILWAKRAVFLIMNLFHLTLKCILILPLFIKVFEKELMEISARFDRKNLIVVWVISFIPMIFLAFLMNRIGRQFENIQVFYFLTSAVLVVSFFNVKLKKFWWMSLLVLILPKIHVFPDKFSAFDFNFNMYDIGNELFKTDLAKYDGEIADRIDRIRTSRTDSVVVPKISEVPKVLYFDELSALGEPKSYTNDQLEKYFQKKSITVEK